MWKLLFIVNNRELLFPVCMHFSFYELFGHTLRLLLCWVVFSLPICRNVLIVSFIIQSFLKMFCDQICQYFLSDLDLAWASSAGQNYYNNFPHCLLSIIIWFLFFSYILALIHVKKIPTELWLRNCSYINLLNYASSYSSSKDPRYCNQLRQLTKFLDILKFHQEKILNVFKDIHPFLFKRICACCIWTSAYTVKSMSW